MATTSFADRSVRLLGGAGADPVGEAAALSDEAIGRLTGFDHPLAGPTVTADAEALELDVTVDAAALARGIHPAGDASLAEIMAY